MISQGRWLFEPKLFPWLPRNEPLADALTDLRTEENKLSVYAIENPNPDLEQNLELKSIIVALAAVRQRPAKFDYALIDLNVLKQLNITFDITKGKTRDDYVNERHRDLVDLSVTKLFLLAKSIQSQPDLIWRVSETNIKRYLKQVTIPTYCTREA